jgi:hypothetical protein
VCRALRNAVDLGVQSFLDFGVFDEEMEGP